MPDPVTAPVVAAGNNPERRPFWRSRKFWAAVVAALIPLLNEALGLNLEPEVVNKAMAGPLSLLGIEAVLDFRSIGQPKA